MESTYRRRCHRRLVKSSDETGERKRLWPRSRESTRLVLSWPARAANERRCVRPKEDKPAMTIRIGIGWLMLLVLAACGGTSTGPSTTPTAPATVDASVDMRLFIEALFLGQGSWAAPGGGCLAGQGVWAGWPRGSLVTIRVSNDLSAIERDAVMGPVNQLDFATGGELRANVQFVEEPNPTPARGEITVAKVADGCSATAAGCAIPTFDARGVISAVRILRVGPPNPGVGPYAHELGHGLYGFCHINSDTTIWKNPTGVHPSTVMGVGNNGGRLSDEDVAAVRAVFAAGLSPGASRAQFVAAGLINP